VPRGVQIGQLARVRKLHDGAVGRSHATSRRQADRDVSVAEAGEGEVVAISEREQHAFGERAAEAGRQQRAVARDGHVDPRGRGCPQQPGQRVGTARRLAIGQRGADRLPTVDQQKDSRSTAVTRGHRPCGCFLSESAEQLHRQREIGRRDCRRAMRQPSHDGRQRACGVDAVHVELPGRGLPGSRGKCGEGARSSRPFASDEEQRGTRIEVECQHVGALLVGQIDQPDGDSRRALERTEREQIRQRRRPRTPGGFAT
jgi:hypothetical protein